MKITPLEIRQKTFEKAFRGLDKDEVNAFLHSMSQEWEKIMDEHKSFVIKLEALENENRKLREVETSLYKTLKAAEDTGASMVEQANKASELQIKETKLKAENIINESKTKAKNIIETSEKEAKQIVKEMMDEVKSLEQSYNMLMALKENLLVELKNFTTDTLEETEPIPLLDRRGARRAGWLIANGVIDRGLNAAFRRCNPPPLYPLLSRRGIFSLPN